MAAVRRLPAGRLPRDPALLLTAMQTPRGAWNRRGRWGVFGGAAATLDSPGEEGDRFAAVGRQGAARTGFLPRAAPRSNGGGDPEDVPLPRFYGGFSFHPDPDMSGPWRAFPSARFHVPSGEVRVEGDRAWILAVRTDDGGGVAEEEARRGLRRMEDEIGRLADLDGGEGESGVPPGPDAGVEAGALADSGEERDRWERSVEEALGRIRDGRLEKVVLARDLDVPAALAAEPVRAFRRLSADNPRSSLFFLQPEPGSAFLAASPELLGSARDGMFRATAVAGSVPRGRDREEDRSLGRRLLESDKDRREQAIVAEEIRRCLTSRLREVSVGSPRLLKLARIQHLESSVEGRFPEGGDEGTDTHLLDVIGKLHPTPAVCGRPRAEALRVLRRAERFERGWYAGPIGWFDSAGRGEFVPGLRSAVLDGGTWRLFAGAGIVDGSDPAREWEETGVKFAPVLRALGVGAGD